MTTDTSETLLTNPFVSDEAAQKKSRAAVVLCAGQGTRMKSALPKVLHTVCGRSLASWVLRAVHGAGVEHTVIVVGHQAEKVQAHMQQAQLQDDQNLLFALQAEQKGTGHAVQMALPALEKHTGTVLVVCGDTPLLTAQTLSALASLREDKAEPVALLTAHCTDGNAAAGYGRIVRNTHGSLVKIVEHRDATLQEREIAEINAGVYAVDAAFLRRALQTLQPNNAQGELYLTDIIALAHIEGAQIPTLSASLTEVMGVNDRAQLATAGQALRMRINTRLMIDGVSIIDPQTTYIDDTVIVGADTVIQPNTLIEGPTIIANHVQIGMGVSIKDCRIDAGARILAHSVCESAHIGPKVDVGPMARIRPESVLEEGARIGNFVEVKKTRVGAGAKANHLAYLGDAEIGSGSNIGAGTITCNYDGIGKHKTNIGNDVFIGSNSTLVAPVTVHTGAYVGAGSVVTREVPSDALAIARARQENKEGYVSRLKVHHAARAGKRSSH